MISQIVVIAVSVSFDFHHLDTWRIWLCGEPAKLFCDERGKLNVGAGSRAVSVDRINGVLTVRADEDVVNAVVD